MGYNENILYKLWLNILCGHNPMLINKLINKFGSAEEIYTSDIIYKKFVSELSLSVRLKVKRSLDKAEELLEYCNKKGIRILSVDDKNYPDSLKEIYAPPQILYVMGQDIDFNKLLCVSVVGSRGSSEDSKRFVYNLSCDLAKAGVIIISGMALGADAAAHKGAIDGGNITIAVLAGGVDIIYPKENKDLYNKILNCGAVISERPPGMSGRGTFYRERNRIITGLSKGVVISEGELKSGTKLTADWAINSNRDLFAIPGKPTDKGSELPNNLIKNSAKLITSAEDILEEYLSVYPKELKYGIDMINEERQIFTEHKSDYNRLYNIEKAPKPKLDSFSGVERTILEYLYEKNSEVHIDDISSDLKIEVSELSFAIIQLIMAKAVKELPGGYYSLA